jgi:Kef-type K+ transport system membrane component KefB
LVVFALCVSTYKSGFSLSRLFIQVLEIAVFIPVMLLTLSRAGGYLLNKVKEDENAYFALMLAIVATAGLLASLINLPDIVGAFLAGLSVNSVTQGNPAKEKLEFFGNALFIPCFFVATGFLIDPVVFYHSVRDNFALAVSIILALLVGKWIAVQIVARIFSYTRASRMTMWSLTLPQVAATLAAALTAYKTLDPHGRRLVDGHLLNVVLVLMLTTSILGPILTERFAPGMLTQNVRAPGPGQPREATAA